jgi:hypothetical protein
MTGLPEILAYAFALGFILLRIWPVLQEIREEQRNPATRYGSKKWHWPALAFLVLLLVASFILISSTSAPSR